MGFGCTATIQRRGLPNYESEILSSDPTAVYLEVEDGRPFVVPADEIRTIDHPGNVLMIIGAALTCVALGFTFVALNDRALSRADATLVGGIYGGAGIGLVIGGAIP